jgi:hypothetical protein
MSAARAAAAIGNAAAIAPPAYGIDFVDRGNVVQRMRQDVVITRETQLRIREDDSLVDGRPGKSLKVDDPLTIHDEQIFRSRYRSEVKQGEEAKQSDYRKNKPIPWYKVDSEEEEDDSYLQHGTFRPVDLKESYDATMAQHATDRAALKTVVEGASGSSTLYDNSLAWIKTRKVKLFAVTPLHDSARRIKAVEGKPAEDHRLLFPDTESVSDGDIYDQKPAEYDWKTFHEYPRNVAVESKETKAWYEGGKIGLVLSGQGASALRSSAERAIRHEVQHRADRSDETTASLGKFSRENAYQHALNEIATEYRAYAVMDHPEVAGAKTKPGEEYEYEHQWKAENRAARTEQAKGSETKSADPGVTDKHNLLVRLAWKDIQDKYPLERHVAAKAGADSDSESEEEEGSGSEIESDSESEQASSESKASADEVFLTKAEVQKLLAVMKTRNPLEEGVNNINSPRLDDYYEGLKAKSGEAKQAFERLTQADKDYIKDSKAAQDYIKLLGGSV